MAFDPDAYIASNTAVAEPPKKGFDPDAYISANKAAPAHTPTAASVGGFNPDAYIKSNSDDRFDPRSPNYDGPVISSAPTPGLLSRAYTAVREKLSPLIGDTPEQRSQRSADSAFLKRTLGVNELPQADASNGEGLIPAAFDNKTPWRLADNTTANDTGRLQLISNLLVPGAGGALAARFPKLAAAGVNSGARFVNTLTSPGSLLTLGLGGELGAVAKAGGEASDVAHGLKATTEAIFTGDQARQLVGQAPETIKAAKDLVTGQGDTQKNIETLLDAGLTGFLTGVGGKAVLKDVAEARAPVEEAPAATPAPEPVKPGSNGVAPVDFIGNTNYVDPVTKQPVRSELFRATKPIPELGIEKAGGTVGRDRLEAAGFTVPETPALDDGAKAQIGTDTLTRNSPFPNLADSLPADRRANIALTDENAREQSLRQSPLGGLALSADLREGRTAIPEDIRARDFQLARDEENRAATAQSLKDALTSNQIGQGENIVLAPDTTEGPPQNNILANLKLKEDLPEDEQFRRYLQSRAGTPPSPLAGLQLKPLPDNTQFTVFRMDTPKGPMQSIQLEIPNPNSTGIENRTLPNINSPEAAARAGYQVPDISKLPEGQTTAAELRGMKLLPDIETKTSNDNATQNGPSAKSDLIQHPQTDTGKLSAETSGSDSSQQGRKITPKQQAELDSLSQNIDQLDEQAGAILKDNEGTPLNQWDKRDRAKYNALTDQRRELAAKAKDITGPIPSDETPFDYGAQSTVTDSAGPNAQARALAQQRIRNLNDRINDVNTDIGTLEQKNNYTPSERWSPEDRAEYNRLDGVRKEITKFRDAVSEKDYQPKVVTTGDAATDEGLREAAEEKPVPEIDNPKEPSGAPPDYKKPGIIAQFGSPLTTELRRIDPEIFGRQQRYETRIRMEPLPFQRRLGDFFNATDKLLTTHEKAAMGNALINGRFDEIEKTINSHAASDPIGTKKALDKFKDTQAMWSELRDRAIAAGVDVNELHSFWPREVIRDRFDDFLKHIGADEKGPIRDAIKAREKELGRPLNTEEQVAIGSSVLRGTNSAGLTAKPGIFKERKIKNVDADMQQFYEDYKKSGVDYVNRLIRNVEKRSLLGQHPGTVESSIPAIVQRLSEQGKMTGPMEDTLKKYLNDRFGVGEESGFRSVRTAKNLTFAGILANPISATTQLISYAQGAMLNGIPSTLLAMAKKHEITLDDFGAHSLSQELQTPSGTGKFLQKALTLGGFTKLDALGKNNILNGALYDMRSAVADTNSSRFKNFQRRYEPVYGSQFPEFVKDLQQGKNTENVKMAVFTRLCDVHPMSLSDMPLKYLQNPNGRVFYQMRTFQIKQLDLFRREVFQEIKKGNVKEGLSNLTRMTLFLAMGGAATDLLKDMMLGREINPPDYVLANLLKLAGLSRYQLYNAYREGLGRAAFDMIAPSAGNAFGVVDDLIHLDKISADPFQSKTLREAPIVGPFLYNYLGPGMEEKKTKILGGGLGSGLSGGLKGTKLHTLGAPRKN